MLLNCRLNTTQMLPERKKQNKNQKDGWDIFAFRNNKTNGQVYNESKFRHWQGITLKNDSLENKKATIYKCSTTFYLYQELILCFRYTLGQPNFSIPLTVKCYYSEIISIVDTATITQVITPLFFSYIHNSNHRGTLSHAHDEKWVETYTLKWRYESTKLTVSQSDGDVRVCTFEYYIQTGCIMCIGETEMMVNVAYALHHCLRTLLVTYSSLKSGNYVEALNLDAPSTITIYSLYD